MIIAIGPQNAHVLRMGLLRSSVGLDKLMTTIVACALTDLVLIMIGVFGLAQLGNTAKWIKTILITGAILFLLNYGYRALLRTISTDHDALQLVQAAMPQTKMAALTTALAFSWLNPHAWIDTAVVVGSASLAYDYPANLFFGIGAAAGSAVWFFGLGLGASLFAPKLTHGAVWRVIDGVVVLTMWATAVLLFLDLLQEI